MKVLIFTKTTTLALHGKQVLSHVEGGRLPKSDIQRLNIAHDEHYQTLAELQSALEDAGILFDITTREKEETCFHGDLYKAVIAVGGDGTLLAASHAVLDAKLPLIGVRSALSSVGSLCLGGREKIPFLVNGLKNDNLPSIFLSRLKAEILQVIDGKVNVTPPILNDFLYAHTNPAATTRYQIKWGDLAEEHKSSGIWFSTAAGSTAVMQAAGGEVMPLSERRFQFWVRELYKLKGQDFRIEHGFFDPDLKPFSLVNRCDKALLALDGPHGCVSLNFGDRITFKRANDLRLIREPSI